MPNRKPGLPLILITVFTSLLLILVYVGTYTAALRFLGHQNDWELPAAAPAVFFTLVFASGGIVLLLEHEDPNRTLSWLLVLLAFPVVGFILYLLFGQRLIKKRKLNRHLRRAYGQAGLVGKTTLRFRKGFVPIASGSRPFTGASQFLEDSAELRMGRLVYNSSGAPITYANWVHILNDGIRIFPAMLAAIAGARHHVHLESYILRDDELGKLFFALLAEKAAAGVQIRIITDGVGSLGLKKKRIQELEKQGIPIRVYFPLRFTLFRNKLNYRNHRKILVVDGKFGFVGGANIGDDYLGLYPDIGNWRDTQLILHGPAAADLQRVFVQDWVALTGRLPRESMDKFYPHFSDNCRFPDAAAIFPDYATWLGKVRRVMTQVQTRAAVPAATTGNGAPAPAASSPAASSPAASSLAALAPAASAPAASSLAASAPAASSLAASSLAALSPPDFQPDYSQAVQIAASGPDSPYESIMQAYHYAISTAKQTIYITSPYFIPNQSILTALKTAALAGISVNLLVPRNPDHLLVYMAAMPYIEDLLEDGVKVWLYRKGFLHSKIVTVDDAIAIVGTANMDRRSFALNFEVNALVYDKKTVSELNAAFQRDLADASPLDLHLLKKRSLASRMLEATSRLLSPLL
jgi:phosphatidylserine/phosphatidylglycerophosphate/cardiolipin synthase-like enzyme